MLKQQKRPIHPGKILQEAFFIPLALNQTECAVNLGIARKTLSLLLHERQSITVDMAVRLAKAFHTTPEFWINLQFQYDVWLVSRDSNLEKIKPYGKAEGKAVEIAWERSRLK